MRQKIIKTGNSLAVVIPSNFVNTIGIKAGQSVGVRALPESGRVIYTFSGAKQLSISGQLKKRLARSENISPEKDDPKEKMVKQ
ncbi:MAG: AbrB/MazE/SpoVT family DNA-binding domain-containing protein [Candidatus Pacebacteria bacterium]|nr:AbrB/MazE/SpoVT family DNA-binding domain-containing protein [Candidatus Paceibacterota bacterium]